MDRMRPHLDSYLKYNGSKAKLAKIIREFYWEFFPGSPLADCFCGSGAVSFGVNPEQAILLDGNRRLINMHQQISDQSFALWDYDEKLRESMSMLPYTAAREWKSYWLALRNQASLLPIYYQFFKAWHNDLRALINEKGFGWDLSTEACIYYAVLAYGFNGICRGSYLSENSTPPGGEGKGWARRPPTLPPSRRKAIVKNVQYTQEWLFKNEFFNPEAQDFQEAWGGSIPDGSLVYADPPYATENGQAPHCYFRGGKFSDHFQERLIDLAAESDLPIMLSNENFPSIVQYCEAKGLKVFSYSRANTISCKGSSRKNAKSDILVLNKPLQKPEYVKFFEEKFKSEVV